MVFGMFDYFFPRKDKARGQISYIRRTAEIKFVNQTVLILATSKLSYLIWGTIIIIIKE